MPSDYTNDYGDAVKGTDDDGRLGPRRAIQTGQMSAAEMKRVIVATAQADANPPNGASIYAAIAGLAPAKCRLFHLLLAIFSGVCAAFYRRLADLAESPIFHRPIFANGYDVYFGAYFRSDYLHVRFAVQATGIFLARRFAS